VAVDDRAEIVDLAAVRGRKPAQIAFPKMTPKQRKELLSGEMGTAFDLYTRLFVSYADGDVFDVGEWRSRDMDVMLRRDGDALMIEQALTLLPRSTTYGLHAAKGDKGEYELVMSQLFQPDYSGGFWPGMATVIGQMSEAAVYRKAFFEKMYELEPDGKLVKLKKLAWRPPTTCDVRRNEHTAEFDGFLQRSWWFAVGSPAALKQAKMNVPKGNVTVGGQKYTGWIPIPKQRSFVYIHGTHRQPLTGVSEMDIVYWAFKQKQKITFLWFQFIEMQAHPKMVTYGPTQDEANDAAQSLASAKASSVIGFERPPGGAKLFELIESSGKGSAEFTGALTYLSNFQAKSVLAGFLELGGAAMMSTGGSFGMRGSYALAESQSKFFLRARQGQVNEMVDAFTRDVIAPLVVLNFGPDAAVPRLSAAPLTEADGSLVVNTLNALAVAQDLRVPDAYVDLIAQKAGEVLDLPADRVQQALLQESSMAMQQAAQLSAMAATPAGQGATKIAATTQAASRAIAAAQAGIFDDELELTRAKGYVNGWQRPSSSGSGEGSSSQPRQ
jgi:hypothetical protein